MISYLKDKWERFAAKRRLARDIQPESFRRMAADLAELADVAAKVSPEEAALQRKADQIRREMAELERMTRRPEFRMLTPEKRRELRESLLLSKDQLLKTVSEAPAPTSLRQ